MTRTTRLSWIVFILLIPITSFSQDVTSTSVDADPDKTKVIYTGRLFGYFRIPSLQAITVDKAALSSCPATSDYDSEAAKTFKLFREKHRNSVLLGTGDNFAPQLEARVFSFLDEGAQHDKYHPANKELHYFDNRPDKWKWVHIDQVSDEMKLILKDGKGTIPTDNVACFLAAAGYAAVVPGRHDFYFGAERLRQLARLMAPLTSEYGRSPQMLGANLVLKTSPVDPGDTVVDRGKPEWMDTNWPKEYSLQNLPKTVYPWFQYFKIKVAGEDAAEFSGYHEKFKTDRFWVCKSKGRPNEIDQPESDKANCKPLERKVSEDPKPTSIVYKLPIDLPEHTGGKEGHFSTLTPNTNYSLCLVRDVPKDKKIFCQRFSVHLPFFYFPRNLPQKGVGKDDYTDPDPFVFIEKKEKKDKPQPDEVIQPHEVAIFGVVDVQLGEHIGVLNFAWKNGNDEFKSVVSVEDPAQALREQLDYFDRWYKNKFGEKSEFKGLKILLAQMNPQRARVLAARFPGFQIVVAGADREQATTEIAQTLEWTSKNKLGTFVAVPAPYFNTQAQTGELNPGFIGAKQNGDDWTLKSHFDPNNKATITDDVKDGSINHTGEITKVSALNVEIDKQVKACLPSGFKHPPKTLPDKLQLVTLCAMREHTSADLAIVQKRDFFAKLPNNADAANVHVQQFLDRFVWKGDLLTLMFVPGKAIKEALKHSSRVDGEEKAVLTLDSEKGRGFEQVGARYDADRDRYLINELPIEDTKTYTVVTTDYLGAGDTGYPELVSAALNPRKQPDEFPKKLETISSIVCRKLYPDEVDDKCLPNIDREAYLDTIAAVPAPPYEQRSAIKRFFRLSPFGRADRSPNADTPSKGHQQEVERRRIWSLSLRKLSLGASALKNNMTDAQIDEQFGGIGITAKRNRAYTVKLDATGAISWHQNQLFLDAGIDYQDLSKGRANEDMEFDHITNRFTLRPGWLWRYPGRGKPHFATVVSLHVETPFRRPKETFFLSSKTPDPITKIEITDRIVVEQERSFTVLPRLGVRWQNRDTTYFEVGVQRGWEIDGFTGYQFITGNNAPVTCLPDATKTIVKCIQEKSTDANPLITKNSIGSAILDTRERSGFYWKSNFTVPFGKIVRYEFSDEGDFFAKNFDSDLVTDTRIRDYSKHSLQFSVFPSLSFGPVVNVLLYQNKINKNWLTQTQLSFEATFSFDFFNRREKFVQIRSKP